MATLESREIIQEIEDSENCPFRKDLCMIGGPGCNGAEWKECCEYRVHGAMWRRLLIFRKIK